MISGLLYANIVLVDDFVGDNVQGNFHLFVPRHWSVIIKVFMYRVRNRALGVGTALLSINLVVVRPAQFVVVIPGKSSLSPPTVTRTRRVSVFCGQMMETRREYATVRPTGTSHFRIKNTVLVPVGMHVMKPYARRPR